MDAPQERKGGRLDPSEETLAVLAARVDEWQVGEAGDVADRIRGFLASHDEGVTVAVEGWAGEELSRLPVPITRAGDTALARRRAVIQRLRAEAAARRGRPDELLEIEFAAWRDGTASAAPYVEHLVALGRSDEAAVVARYVLSSVECPDRARIEATLNRIGAPPDGWGAAVLAFAAAPSDDAWEALMRFTPSDVFYQRTRNTLQMLIRLRVDGDVLFRCATRYATTPDAIELVERGLVAPETVVQRGREGPPEALGLWLGLAAQAAFARGDRFRTVRLLREAMEKQGPFAPVMNVLAIREAADDELHDMLDKAGIPR